MLSQTDSRERNSCHAIETQPLFSPLCIKTGKTDSRRGVTLDTPTKYRILIQTSV